jgi:hypothetical protein
MYARQVCSLELDTWTRWHCHSCVITKIHIICSSWLHTKKHFQQAEWCYTCGKPGHIRKEKLGSSVVFKKTVAKCPTVKLNIAGIIVTCLLDIGSMVSTITESLFFNKNLLSNLNWIETKPGYNLEQQMVWRSRTFDM